MRRRKNPLPSTQVATSGLRRDVGDHSPRSRPGEEIKEGAPDPHRNRYSAISEGSRCLTGDEYLDGHEGGNSSGRAKCGFFSPTRSFQRRYAVIYPSHRANADAVARIGDWRGAARESSSRKRKTTQTFYTYRRRATHDRRARAMESRIASHSVSGPRKTTPCQAQLRGQETAVAETSNFIGGIQRAIALPLGGGPRSTTEDETRPR